MSTTEELVNRVSLYNNVLNCDPVNRDMFLDEINTLANKHPSLIRNHIKAYKHFTRNSIVKDFVEKCRSKNLNIFIGGSAPLASCCRQYSFSPSDLDIYIKRCSLDKLINIENVIHDIFNEDDGFELLVIRSPIVVTWIVYKNNQVVYQIQANVLMIESWSEIFVTYHVDIVCVGYDILQNKFLYLKNRWDNIVNTDKIHIFSNIFSCDSEKFLKRSVKKYTNRGFKCDTFFVKKDMKRALSELQNEDEISTKKRLIDIEPIDSSDGGDENNRVYVRNGNPGSTEDIVNLLLVKYKYRKNISYTQSVKDVYSICPVNVPNEIDLWKLYNDDSYEYFMLEPSRVVVYCSWIKDVKQLLSAFVHKDIINKIITYVHKCDNICSLESDKHNIFITFKRIDKPNSKSKCDHKISLYSFLKSASFDSCPLCKSSRHKYLKSITRSLCC